MAISTQTATRCIHQGLLQKRCRLSWRPRHVEVISDPTDMAGHLYSFQLLIYDPRKRMLKDKIRMESIVTIRASRDCHFQIFLSNGKIVQFKTETIATQAHWIAMLKMGLGRGNIFHVILNSVSELEHALLFSVGVNLPAHRAGQLDRVLVLASPINDINLHAWDLNRVTRFIELDIGIRMELCPSCVRGQNNTLTFVIEKQFVKDCMSFLRKEAQISTAPVDNHGLLIHTVPHRCFFRTPPSEEAPPPPYKEHEAAPPLPRKRRVNNMDSAPSGAIHVHQMKTRNGIGVMEIRTHSQSEPVCPLPILSNHPVCSLWDDSPTSRSGSFLRESQFQKHHDEDTDSELSYKSDLPPRDIPRANYESSVSAEAQPYLQYHPHLYSSSGNRHFEPPYHVSNRIVITDSGEVQFERNVMSSLPYTNENAKFHLNRRMPVPPRGLGADSSSKMLRTKLTLEANCGHEEDFHSYININRGTSANTEAHSARRSSYTGPFETREYVNFPISTTPPPTTKLTGRYPPRLNRTNSDSELNYTTGSTSRITVDAHSSGKVKRASEVSVSSDIYIIPRSPHPGRLPFVSSMLEEDGSLTTHELCLEGSVAGNEFDSEYISMRGSAHTIFGHHSILSEQDNNTLTDPQALNQSSNQGSVQDENKKPQSEAPVPLPRRKPAVPQRNNNLQKSISLEASPKSKDDSFLNKPQKRPVPRPRTKTAVQISVNVKLSDENSDTNPVNLQSHRFYTDENGVGVTDL